LSIKPVEGQRFICSNPACRREIVMPKSSDLLETKTVRCTCGASMKKPYSKPALEKRQDAALLDRLKKTELG
jgi:CDGSH-type Zn-finger protein